MKSYHDITVIVDGKKYRMDNYAHRLTCTKASGWCLWSTWDGSERLLGGEYEPGEFTILVGKTLVCGRRQVIGVDRGLTGKGPWDERNKTGID